VHGRRGYGNILSVDTATDENTKLITAHSVEELHDMLSDARRNREHWCDDLDDFVNDPESLAHVTDNGPPEQLDGDRITL